MIMRISCVPQELGLMSPSRTQEKAKISSMKNPLITQSIFLHSLFLSLLTHPTQKKVGIKLNILVLITTRKNSLTFAFLATSQFAPNAQYMESTKIMKWRQQERL